MNLEESPDYQTPGLVFSAQHKTDNFKNTCTEQKHPVSKRKKLANLSGLETLNNKIGQCRCCLKVGIQNTGNIWEITQCFNLELSIDIRITRLVCSECSQFVQQARRFRDMVSASQETLLGVLYSNKTSNTERKLISFDIPCMSDDNQVKNEVKEESEMKTPNRTEEAFVNTVKQEHFKREKDTLIGGIDNAGTEIGHHGHLDQADGATMDHDGNVHFSDDTNFETEAKEDKQNITSREVKYKTKLMEAQLNLRIRHNLTTILQNSTIIPFTTAKGDQFECVYCDGNYTEFAELRHHVETKHSDEEYDFILQALNLIPELILRADVSVTKCRLCNAQFKTIDNLVLHLQTLHNKEFHNLIRDPPHNILCFNMSSGDLKCIDCEKTFTHFRGLLMHMNAHYGSYLCPECGSKFLYESSYKLHLYSKRNKKVANRYQCTFCDISYSRKDHLSRHVKSKHPNVSKDSVNR